MIEDLYNIFSSARRDQIMSSTNESLASSFLLSDLPAFELYKDVSSELESQREEPIFTPEETFIQSFAPDPRPVPPLRSRVPEEAIESSRDSTNKSRTPIKAGKGEVVAQVTRYGYIGDPDQNHTATTKGSKHENIGNRNNILEDGVSVALSPEMAKSLGINPKAGDFVEANLGGKWQRFRVDDTTAEGLTNFRLDFFDPSGRRKKIDGKKVRVRKVK